MMGRALFSFRIEAFPVAAQLSGMPGLHSNIAHGCLAHRNREEEGRSRVGVQQIGVLPR
jgi:hypothetical protein